MNSPSVVIYSANFGNYRKELKNGIDNINFQDEIDYYFFTDTQNLKSNHWNIRMVSHQVEETDYLNRHRHNSKHFKFILPPELKSYDIIVWIDSKILKSPAILPNYKQIINRLKNRKICFVKHPHRNSIQEELEITLERNIENHNTGWKLYDTIKDNIYDLPLVDSCFMMYRNVDDVYNFLVSIYENLIMYNIQRDQNIISLAFSLQTNGIGLKDVDLTLTRPNTKRKDILKEVDVQKYFPNKRVAIILSGMITNLKHTYLSITQNILQILERNGILYDMCMHTFTPDPTNNTQTRDTPQNEKDHIYLPCQSVLMEDVEEVLSRLHFSHFMQTNFLQNNHENLKQIVLQNYSKKMSAQMIRENINLKIDYDYVLFLRSDCLYYQPLFLHYYFHAKNGNIVIPSFNLDDNFNDHFMICDATDFERLEETFHYLFSNTPDITPTIPQNQLILDTLMSKNINISHIDFHYAIIENGNTMKTSDEKKYKKILKLKNINNYPSWKIRTIFDKSSPIIKVNDIHPKKILKTYGIIYVMSIFTILIFLSLLLF